MDTQTETPAETTPFPQHPEFRLGPMGVPPSDALVGYILMISRSNMRRHGYDPEKIEEFSVATASRVRAQDVRLVAGKVLEELHPAQFHREL